MADGKGCTCFAACDSECCCDADWTPQIVYDQKEEIERLREELKTERVLSFRNQVARLEEQLFNAEQQIYRVEKERNEELAASRAREAKLRGLVTTLWDLLDDIDTASDIAKSDDKLYRGIVDQTQRKRWATGITSDGHTLTLPVANDDTTLREMLAAEREACAQVCEVKGQVKGGEVFAARIRARGAERG